MASTITEIVSATQKLMTGIVTKFTRDPLAYAMMGVTPAKRITAAIYVVGFAVLYGFFMRIFFRAEDMLSSEELMAEEPLASDDILSMLGDMLGSGVDAITNAADVVSEAVLGRPKPTNAARQVQNQAQKVAKAAAAVRRTAWYHHFLRGLIFGLIGWNVLAILAYPPKDDVLADNGFPEFFNTTAAGYRSSGMNPTPKIPSYVPYYKASAATVPSTGSAYRSSGISWTPVSRCGR